MQQGKLLPLHANDIMQEEITKERKQIENAFRKVLDLMLKGFFEHLHQ